MIIYMAALHAVMHAITSVFKSQSAGLKVRSLLCGLKGAGAAVKSCCYSLFLNPSDCRFEGKVPAVHAEKGAEAAAELGQQVGPLVDAYVACLEARKIKDGIRHVMAISSVGESTARLLQVLYCSNNLLSITRSSAINPLTSHL